eukprot:1928271-Amphidinium_carterae.1
MTAVSLERALLQDDMLDVVRLHVQRDIMSGMQMSLLALHSHINGLHHLDEPRRQAEVAELREFSLPLPAVLGVPAPSAIDVDASHA